MLSLPMIGAVPGTFFARPASQKSQYNAYSIVIGIVCLYQRKSFQFMIKRKFEYNTNCAKKCLPHELYCKSSISW